MESLRNHGITRESERMLASPDGPWYYEQIELGYNYRMTDIHAALGLSQLARLDRIVERRREIAHRYDKLLSGLPLVRPWQDPQSESSWHLYVVRLHLAELAVGHRTVFERMRESGIGVNLHYIPIYRQPFHRARDQRGTPCREAESYYKEALSLPLFPSLSFDDQDKVVDALTRALLP